LNNSYVVFIDSTTPSVSNTAVNSSKVNINEIVCVNATVQDTGIGLDKVWAYITYPNATEANITMDDDISSCSGSIGDNIFGIDINVSSTEGNLTINTTYANDTLNNLGYESPWPILNVNVTNAGVAISIDLSPKLGQQINWSLISLPIYNQSAEGNNYDDATDYYVNISVEGGTADLYIKSSSDLMTQGLDVLGLGNETFSYNTTNSSVPDSQKFALTTSYLDNQVGNNLGDGSVIYLKFFLSAPSGQAAGTYNNSLSIKAVPNGEMP